MGASVPVVENICGTMYPRQGNPDWGNGAYFIPDTFQVQTYTDTIGTKSGYLKTVDGYLYLFDLNNNQLDYHYSSGDIEYIGHPSYQILKAKSKSESEFVNCFWNHISGGLFISKSELKRNLASFYTYQELLCSEDLILKGHAPPYGKLGVNLPDSCLELRTGPSLKSPVITCIPGNDINPEGETHLRIIESEGPWSKVEVTTLTIDNDITEDIEDEPCPSILVSNHIGWLQAINNFGFPNIWYSVSGY